MGTVVYLMLLAFPESVNVQARVVYIWNKDLYCTNKEYRQDFVKKNCSFKICNDVGPLMEWRFKERDGRVTNDDWHPCVTLK